MTRSPRRMTYMAARTAAFLLATGLGVTSAGAEVPGWAAACAATTPNPWIKSGYCESHNAWDKYYCQCAFVPDHPLPGFGGRRQHDLDFDADTFPDEDVTPK